MPIDNNNPLYLRSKNVVFGGANAAIDLSGTTINLSGSTIDLSGSSIDISLNDLNTHLTNFDTSFINLQNTITGLGNLESTIQSLSSMTDTEKLTLNSVVSDNTLVFNISAGDSKSYIGWDISGTGILPETTIATVVSITSDLITVTINNPINLNVIFDHDDPNYDSDLVNDAIASAGEYTLTLGIVKKISLIHQSVDDLYQYLFNRKS